MSAEKRRAAAGVARFWRGPGVTPNASKGSQWRCEAGRTYPLSTETVETLCLHGTLTLVPALKATLAICTG